MFRGLCGRSVAHAAVVSQLGLVNVLSVVFTADAVYPFCIEKRAASVRHEFVYVTFFLQHPHGTFYLFIGSERYGF